MAVISTPPSFQLLMAYATVSTGPFMHFQEQQDLKSGVHGAASAGGATSWQPGHLHKKAYAGIVRMLPNGFLLTSPTYASSVKQL